jgi:uncharacterized protein
MVVFDSSPLIHLTQIGKISFIVDFFKEITIPPAVYKEVIEQGTIKGESDAKFLQQFIDQDKIKCDKMENENKMLVGVLHEGEREAIMLAKARSELLIIDDRKARTIAEQYGIKYHGTLGIIYLLFKENKISRELYLENLKRYTEKGWISVNLYEMYRKKGDINE